MHANVQSSKRLALRSYAFLHKWACGHSQLQCK